MCTVQASKDALRKEIKKKILLLTKEQKQRQSDIVTKKLLHLTAFQNSRRISVYLNTEHEISTESILRKIYETGKKCFIPRYDLKQMEMVRLLSIDDWKALPLTKWNIKQPHLSEKRENAFDTGGLDLIIIPGVAFTTDGKRLGHGKGYYDSFQANLSQFQIHKPTTVGLCFKEQILNDIPTQNFDVKVDLVLYAE